MCAYAYSAQPQPARVPSRCAGLSQTCGDALQHCLIDLSTDDGGASNALPRRPRPKPPGRRVKYGWTKLCQGGSAAVHNEASCLAIDRVIRKWKNPTIRHRCARARVPFRAVLCVYTRCARATRMATGAEAV